MSSKDEFFICSLLGLQINSPLDSAITTSDINLLSVKFSERRDTINEFQKTASLKS